MGWQGAYWRCARLYLPQFHTKFHAGPSGSGLSTRAPRPRSRFCEDLDNVPLSPLPPCLLPVHSPPLLEV
eukprot:789009-Prymnesium_polylepis.2